MGKIWATKHRPTDLTGFQGQGHLIDEMEAICGGQAPMQHYIFYSPEAGTGKTSLAHIIAKARDYTIHQYNASSKHQRGIEFVEQELGPMSRLGQYETIFFLDEADQLTPAAQSALKGVIEDSQGYFILTCNDLSKVSPWLQSRCQVRTFEPLAPADISKRLVAVCAKEGLSMPSEDVDAITHANRGDLRNAINTLQAYHSLPVDKRQSFLLSLTEPPFDAHQVLTLCMKEGRPDEAVKVIGETNNLRRSIDTIFHYGIDSPAKPANKLKLVDAATQAQRDLLMGVEAHYVVWDFCRRLAQ
jgi:DNA polymerase III delta prime subunit